LSVNIRYNFKGSDEHLTCFVTLTLEQFENLRKLPIIDECVILEHIEHLSTEEQELAEKMLETIIDHNNSRSS